MSEILPSIVSRYSEKRTGTWEDNEQKRARQEFQVVQHVRDLVAKVGGIKFSSDRTATLDKIAKVREDLKLDPKAYENVAVLQLIVDILIIDQYGVPLGDRYSLVKALYDLFFEA